MAIDFPNSPSINELFTVDNVTYIWDGITWDILDKNVDYIDFNLINTVTNSVGRLYWDAAEGTLEIGMPNNSAQSIGMEFYMPPTKNNSGTTIPNGSFVMATGAQGDRITIAKAITNGTVDPMYMIGVATQDIPNGAEDGLITIFGTIRDLNTAAWPVGTVLYPNPSVAGGFTSIKPDAPNIRTPIAIVLRQHANTGRIYVRMTTGSGLGETDSNVKFTSLLDGDLVVYNDTTDIWENTKNLRGTYSMDTLDLIETQLTANVKNINVITAFLIDSFPSSSYRSAEYILQLSQGLNYAMTKLMLIHDGTDVAISEYGHVEIGTSIPYNFNASYSLGNLEITITCSTANISPVDLKFTRTLFDA